MGEIDIVLEEAEEAKREASGPEDEIPEPLAQPYRQPSLVTRRSHGDTKISRYSQRFEILSMHRGLHRSFVRI
jgi:hypothetical protein